MSGMWDVSWEVQESLYAKQHLFGLCRMGISFVLIMVLAVGILLIPMSLKKLGGQKQDEEGFE